MRPLADYKLSLFMMSEVPVGLARRYKFTEEVRRSDEQRPSKSLYETIKLN